MRFMWHLNYLFHCPENCFLVESTKIENATLPYKTALSQASVKTNGGAKSPYYKEWSFTSDYFILFQFKNL